MLLGTSASLSLGQLLAYGEWELLTIFARCVIFCCISHSHACIAFWALLKLPPGVCWELCGTRSVRETETGEVDLFLTLLLSAFLLHHHRIGHRGMFAVACKNDLVC